MDRLRVQPNERVDISDFRAGAGGDLVLADQMRQTRVFILPTGRKGTLANTSARIIDGFGCTLATPIVTVARGSGFFPLYENGVVTWAVMLGTEDPASLTVDLSGDADGDYYIYVRAVASDAVYENRVFWNPSGAPATELVGHMATRRVQSWEITHAAIAAAAPGHGEWVPIAKATKAGGVVTVVADYRHLWFEGSKPDSYAQEWGDGTNDRNADRAAYGAKDLHMLGQLVRRQLADIIGVKHYTLVPRHLTDLAVQHKAGGDHGNVYAETLGVSADGDDDGWQTYTRAKFGATDTPHRGTKVHGHLVRPHEFFDDFFYTGDTNGLISTGGSELPWGFRGVSGSLGVSDNNAFMVPVRGGVVKLHGKASAPEGIDMISGYNMLLASFQGWWDLLDPLCTAMIRFKTPADISALSFIVGLVVGGDPINGPYALAYYDATIDGNLTARVKGALVGGSTVPLVALAGNTWYTLRLWTKSGTTMQFQLNNAAPVDVAVNIADTIQAGGYDLFVRCMNQNAPAGKDLLVDQAFAADGSLAADME